MKRNHFLEKKNQNRNTENLLCYIDHVILEVFSTFNDSVILWQQNLPDVLTFMSVLLMFLELF